MSVMSTTYACGRVLLLEMFRELVDMQPLVNARFVWLGRHIELSPAFSRAQISSKIF
jgi:hypothetical protein